MNAKKCKILRKEAVREQEFLNHPITPNALYVAKTHRRSHQQPVFNSIGALEGFKEIEKLRTQVLLSHRCTRFTYKMLKCTG